jgi:hypothetical protein
MTEAYQQQKERLLFHLDQLAQQEQNLQRSRPRSAQGSGAVSGGGYYANTSVLDYLLVEKSKRIGGSSGAGEEGRAPALGGARKHATTEEVVRMPPISHSPRHPARPIHSPSAASPSQHHHHNQRHVEQEPAFVSAGLSAPAPHARRFHSLTPLTHTHSNSLTLSLTLTHSLSLTHSLLHSLNRPLTPLTLTHTTHSTHSLITHSLTH